MIILATAGFQLRFQLRFQLSELIQYSHDLALNLERRYGDSQHVENRLSQAGDAASLIEFLEAQREHVVVEEWFVNIIKLVERPFARNEDRRPRVRRGIDVRHYPASAIYGYVPGAKGLVVLTVTDVNNISEGMKLHPIRAKFRDQLINAAHGFPSTLRWAAFTLSRYLRSTSEG